MIKKILFFTLALATMAACSSNSNGNTTNGVSAAAAALGWTTASINNAIQSCIQNDGGTQTQCQCAVGIFDQSVSAAEYANNNSQSGEPPAILQAYQTCGIISVP